MRPDEGISRELADAKLDPPESVAAQVAAEAERRLFGLESTETGAPPKAAARAGTFARGDVVGRYVVLRKLGEGGMGVVMQAYDPRLDRSVALKFLRAERGTADERRLVREAKAMARLRHPNVVAVHDVGEDDRGLFIAMDFVDGPDLAEWLTVKERSWQEIVAMFRGAGRGLAAAHAAGTAHRDFKPANVLVDSDGTPLVADFGLALGLPREQVDAAVAEREPEVRLTRSRAFLGTPAYASPEQFQGEPVDSRSDQFSFCVGLWEALHGERPFKGATLAELAWAVGQGEIRPPLNRSVPRRITRALERGLAVRPEDRHPSMRELLAELTPRSRTRTRLAIGGGALALAVAAVVVPRGVADTCDPASEQRRFWSPDMRRAVERAFQGVDETSGEPVLALLDRYASDWGEAFTAACRAHENGAESGELLDKRTRCLRRRSQRASALAHIFATSLDEETAHRAIHAVESLPRITDCSDSEQMVALTPLPADPNLRRRIEETEAELDRAASLEHAGKFGPARDAIEALLPAARELDHVPLLAEALQIYAEVLSPLDENELALERAREAAKSAAAVGDDRLLARASLFVPALLDDLGRERECIELEPMLEAVAIRAGSNEALAKFHTHVAACYSSAGKRDVALRHLNDALKVADAATTPKLRGTILNNLASEYQAMGKPGEALAAIDESIALRQEVLGPGHYYLGSSIAVRGSILEALGDYEAALEAQRLGVSILRRASKVTTGIAEAESNLAATLVSLGRRDEAIEAFRTALDVYEEVAPRSRDAGIVHANLGTMLATVDAAASEEHLREALGIIEKTGPMDLHAHILVTLGNSAYWREDLETARELYDRGLAMRRQQFGSEHLDVANSIFALAVVDIDEGEYTRARERLLEALEIERKLRGPRSRQVARGLDGLAATENALGNAEEARRLYIEAQGILRELFPGGHPKLAEVTGDLAALVKNTNGCAAALEQLEDAVAAWGNVSSRPVRSVALRELAECKVELGDPDAAIPLFEAALEARSEDQSARRLAKIRMGLAEALVAAGNDRTRASELASQVQQSADGDPELLRRARRLLRKAGEAK